MVKGITQHKSSLPISHCEATEQAPDSHTRTGRATGPAGHQQSDTTSTHCSAYLTDACNACMYATPCGKDRPVLGEGRILEARHTKKQPIPTEGMQRKAGAQATVHCVARAFRHHNHQQLVQATHHATLQADTDALSELCDHQATFNCTPQAC